VELNVLFDLLSGYVVIMPKRARPTSRWLTAASWPFGVALTSWDYMWRTTPMHRREAPASLESALPELLSYPPGVSSERVQGHEDGCGPLFHRRYRTRIRESRLDARELMAKLQADLNRASPTRFARFQLVHGERGRVVVGDEYVVRMPGPWDGPVRVVDVGPCSFRLATLAGHLEAGQIEFRASSHEQTGVVFEIESWARSSSPLVNLLYHRLRMAKEVQAHMWISFLGRVAHLAAGRMTGGIELDTERIETPAGPSISDPPVLGSAKIRRRLAELDRKRLNFDLAALADASPRSGWTITELCQPLPGEPPGMPLDEGSWQTARRLMSGYEFADPTIVRAYYDPTIPLERRNMLLRLQAPGCAHLFVGVRVGEVYEQTRELDGRRARIWGWNYRTLEGHVEMGQMDWEVWKWLDDGRVEFRVHAVSRAARTPNPIVRLGFHLLRSRERRAFLDSTKRRIRTFTELALAGADPDRTIREAAAAVTARPARDADAAHEALARSIKRS
jgi:uncharacterized protein (UPF0548 family)